MNLTIPIRAQSSTSSWTRDTMRGNYSLKNRNLNRTRYIFSISTALLLISSLIVGSVGGMLQGASARDNFNRTGYHSSSNHGETTGNTAKPPTTTTTTSPTKTATPAVTSPAKTTTPVTAPEATTPAPSGAPDPAPAPVEKTTPQVAAQPVAPATPSPADTAPAIASMTAAQADKSTQNVTYTSNRISDETRNRIFILAGVATITGALLYTMSVLGAAPITKRTIPIRYTVPVREVIRS